MTFDTPQYLIETDLSLLKTLRHKSQLELISALSLSMTKESKDQELAQTLFGAFETHQNAEQLTKEIQQSRYFNRVVETL